MIHIATIHWPTGKWIPIQLLHLKRNIQGSFRTYAVLAPGIESKEVVFDYLDISNNKDHARHLNHLMKIVLEEAGNDEDILLYLDGDAFPIASLDLYLDKKLSKFPMIALERLENAGEYVPHPSFCAARIGWWKEIGEKWGRGSYIRDFGKDPGVKMFEELNERNVIWGRIHRSNRMDLHPLFFGIYDDVIYHHGAGFRAPISRADIENNDLAPKRNHLVSKLIELLPNLLFKSLKRRLSPFRREEFGIIQENQGLHKMVFNHILESETFYRQFL